MKQRETGSSFAMAHQWRAMLYLLFALCVGIWSGQSRASATCTGTPTNYTLAMPASVAIPRDAPAGTMLSGWVSSPAVTNFFTCVVDSSTSTGTWFQMNGLTLTSSGLVVPRPTGSGTLSVYNTNVPGVGVAITERQYINGCGWTPWWNPNATGNTSNACNQNGTAVTNGGQVQIALVKTGPITSGTVTGGVYINAGITNNYIDLPAVIDTFSLTSTVVTVLACVTPNVMVDLGTHMTSELATNSTTAAVPFNISLNACPSGNNTVQYQIDAVTAIVDPANSVVALDSSSRATGVGVQLLTANGTTLPLGTPLAFSDYSVGGGSFTIPLKARYYKTAATVGAGSANTSLTFTMTYQ